VELAASSDKAARVAQIKAVEVGGHYTSEGPLCSPTCARRRTLAPYDSISARNPVPRSQENTYRYGVKAMRSGAEKAQDKAESRARHERYETDQVAAETVQAATPKWGGLPAEQGAHRRDKERMAAEAEAVEAAEYTYVP
jgi:hypothetical protein